MRRIRPFLLSYLRSLIALICFASTIGTVSVFTRVVMAQTAAAAIPGAGVPTQAYQFWTFTTTDPWFWGLVGAWLFSCVVSGMPEPEHSNGPFYIWAYRSLHLMAAAGTQFFQRKELWLTPEQLRSAMAAAANKSDSQS